jgi:ubiquinone/menaquinone biosynthesis C-methylase UbiE
MKVESSIATDTLAFSSGQRHKKNQKKKSFRSTTTLDDNLSEVTSTITKIILSTCEMTRQKWTLQVAHQVTWCLMLLPCVGTFSVPKAEASWSHLKSTVVTNEAAESPKVYTPDETFVDMTTDPGESLKVYDAWARNYERDIRLWGYDMPERVASLLTKFVVPSDSVKILDAGAGDGLSGVALRNVGYNQVQACDLSPEMLLVAESRKCYTQTDVLDLSQTPLPYADEAFDAVTCVGTLTYVDPDAGTLLDFIRITRSGGFICFTNRTDKLEKWEKEQARLESKGLWKLVDRSGPLPYLPGNPEYGENVKVVMYLYRVL